MIPLHVVIDVETVGFDAMKRLKQEHPAASHDYLVEAGFLIHMSEGEMEVGGLANATAKGAPAVAFCFALPDGKVVLMETTLALLNAATSVLNASLGQPPRPQG